MTDEWTAPCASFAMRLATDLLMSLVLNGTIPRGLAAAIVDQGLAELVATEPEYETQFREIAAAITTQIGMALIDAQAMRRREIED
jgi:hypothetical protein